MTVVPFTATPRVPQDGLTETDVSQVIAWAYRLIQDGRASDYVRDVAEDGSVSVAVMDEDGKEVRYVVARERGRYAVIDERGWSVSEGAAVEDVLSPVG